MKWPDLRWPRPIDSRDDDYLIVWTLVGSFILFVVGMFMLWWKGGGE